MIADLLEAVIDFLMELLRVDSPSKQIRKDERARRRYYRKLEKFDRPTILGLSKGR